MMEKFWNAVKALVVIVLILAICFAIGFFVSKKAWKERALIAEDNVDALTLSKKELGDGFALTQKLTLNQFERELGSYVDSINELNDEKIRLKQLLRMTRFEFSRYVSNRAVMSTDTFLIRGTDTITIGRKGVLKDDCFSTSVFVPDTGDVFYFDQSIDIKGSAILHRKRKRQVAIGKLKLFRVGKFVDRMVINTNCDSIRIDVTDIEVLHGID